MATDYLACPIADLLESGALAINDGYRAKNSELADHGIPFARAGNIDGGFHFDDADRVPSETLSRVGVKVSEPGDVVFTSKGTVGRFAFVRDSTPRFVYSPQLCFWRVLDPTRISPHWLYYWMNSREFFLQFKGVAGQTDMAEYVSLRDQRAMQITLPPMSEQKRIAHILGTLDDKIELNGQMNATLEAMSRAIFKSWFVDFDPVRQKAAGKQPVGMATQTAALFPDSFEESEIGEVPTGWTTCTLDDHTELVIGGDWGDSEPSSEAPAACLCVRGADIPSLHAGGVGKMPTRYLKPGSLGKRRLLPWDIVVEISGGSPTQSTGRPVLVTDDFIARLPLPLIASNFCRILKLKEKEHSPFVYLYLRHLYDAGEFLQYENGTTGIKNFAYTLFAARHPLLAPDHRVLRAFAVAITPTITLHQQKARESDALAAVRDTLLPKLLSGEIRVPEAEETEEEAIA